MVRTFDDRELHRATVAVDLGNECEIAYAEACLIAGLDPAKNYDSPLLTLVLAAADKGDPS